MMHTFTRFSRAASTCSSCTATGQVRRISPPEIAYVYRSHTLLVLHVSVPTGQLKEGLREYLKTNSYVTKSQPAEEVDGGDAFTLATLRKK